MGGRLRVSSNDGTPLTLRQPRAEKKKWGKQMEGETRGRNGGILEAARIFHCKCCFHTTQPVAKEPGWRWRWVYRWMDKEGKWDGVARCDVRWPELFGGTINLAARSGSFEGGQRYKPSLATGSVAGQRSESTHRSAYVIISSASKRVRAAAMLHLWAHTQRLQQHSPDFFIQRTARSNKRTNASSARLNVV